MKRITSRALILTNGNDGVHSGNVSTPMAVTAVGQSL